MNKYKEAIKYPKIFRSKLFYRVTLLFSPIISSDKTYLKLQYFLRMNRVLNLKNPKSYTEKLQWLKLYDRKPLYNTLVDKFEVKKYVAEKIGDEYVIPTLGVWDSVDDIEFNRLPQQFVLKCTHDSGGVIICKDKSTFDIDYAKRSLNKSLKDNYYKKTREWPYKDLQRRVIAEKYIEIDGIAVLNDYKFFCFNGEVKLMFIATDRGIDTHFDFFDRNFKHLDIVNGHPMSGKLIEKPIGFDRMVEIAEKLSKGLPQIRVDLYDVNGEIYFGEMTLFHWGGMMPFEPKKWDYTMGEWLTLPYSSK